MKKIKIYSELVYVLAIIFIAFAVAMITSTNFGISMIVAPAYILSQKFPVLSFGQSEYVLQALMFIAFCIIVKKIKLVYVSSFVTCIIYGAVLDLWRWIIPLFNPDITPPGSLPLIVKIVFFIFGMVLTSFAVAMFFKTYIYPQVYDFFVKAVSTHFNIDINKFKRGYDVTSFVVAVLMSLLFFHSFVGIGIGTIIMTVCNSFIIKWSSEFIDKHFEIKALFPKFEKKFDID